MNSSEEKECGNCSFKDRWLIHYLRHRGEYRQLCTSCVLKLHPTNFCPVCFSFFESPVPQHDRVTCEKCPSITHLNCCVSNSDRPHTCPSCSNPNFRFFDVKRNDKDQFEIDLKNSKALLCAARIAADSMEKAVRMAEADAMRKVKEAVASKKRTKIGLEELCAKEKIRKLREDISYGEFGSQNRATSSTIGRMDVESSVSVLPSNHELGSGSGHTGNLDAVQGGCDSRGKSNIDGNAGIIATDAGSCNTSNSSGTLGSSSPSSSSPDDVDSSDDVDSE